MSINTPEWLGNKLKSLTVLQFNHAIDALYFAAGEDGMATYESNFYDERIFECVSCDFRGGEDDTWSVCSNNLKVFTRVHLLIELGYTNTEFNSGWCDPEPVEMVRYENCCCALRKCYHCWNADYERILANFENVMPQYENWANSWLLPRQYTDDDGTMCVMDDIAAEIAASLEHVDTFDWDEKGQLILYDFKMIEQEKICLSEDDLHCYWQNKFVNNVFIKIRVCRWIARVRERLYAPNGSEYLMAKQRWGDMVAN
jgi:hypothetical protein